MPSQFWKGYVAGRRQEIRHTFAGVGIGSSVCVAGLVIDSQIRSILGLDASLKSTFFSTPMHSFALIAPVLLGYVFRSIGVWRRRLDDTLRMTRQLEAAAREKAARDPVTGLFNRNHLMQLLEEGLAMRSWSRRDAILYLFDLDEFKLINDTHGHHVGDLVLVEIARRMRMLCGSEDLAVRLGGDEFVMVHFPGAGCETGGADFAAVIVAALSEPIFLGNSRIEPRISIGFAQVGRDGATCSDVLKAADLALYKAKPQPGSAFQAFTPALREEHDRRVRLENEMRAGIAKNEFFLEYQPIFGTESGALRSFEALLRWRHPEQGLVPPLDFIPLAESTGMILQIGRNALAQACRAALSWPKPVGVSVNLSPVQFNDPQLVDHIEAVLAETGLAPGRLDIEITESMLLEASARVSGIVARLKAIGVRVTMDDFGTGFSSLSTLKNFPFDRLKIDRSFTRDLATDPDGAEIVRAIVRLSRALRMETILEGVETVDQLSFARREALTEVQGYYFSRPLSLGKAAELAQAPDRSSLLAGAA
ncbi:hypothetical protein GCM10011390_01000 [Aureimonas endophytica]|uniref:Diguanylate cyclase (GGDEF)-like protein n=1 Tax=Aureimonas endophytica TaxID=2027858 RepID=A0A916ZBJ1_9HYPH|nr:bifunctional diguanylate cyclase/phosphodiesterase [Aureimonas endophytica]GGD86189.1 hypothetical protein GCM10011390_01000 [Aureimonas endophytica]